MTCSLGTKTGVDGFIECTPACVSHPSVGNCVTHLKPHSTVQKSQPALSLLPRLSFYKVVWSNYCPGFMDVFQTFSLDSRSQKSHN